MPEVVFKSLLQSQPYVVVGPNKTCFYAHEDLLTQCSDELRIVIRSGGKEAKAKTIEIKDVDGDIDDDTLMRFIEYAYSTDYTVPEPKYPTTETCTSVALAGDADSATSEPKSSSAAPWYNDLVIQDDSNDQTKLLPWDHGLTLKERKKKQKNMMANGEWESRVTDRQIEDMTIASEVQPATMGFGLFDEPPKSRTTTVEGTVKSSRAQLWLQFCEQTQVAERSTWQPVGNDNSLVEYTEIFLCHARLYKFSERFDVPSLASLSLQKLRLSLSRFTFHQERAPDVAALIRYTYYHTMEYERGCDKLRQLVLDYAMCHIKQLGQEPRFMELLKEYGSLASDVVTGMMELII